MTDQSKQIIPDTQAVARFVDQEILKNLDSNGTFMVGELLEKLKESSVDSIDRKDFTDELVNMILGIVHNGHSREYLVNKISNFIKGSEIDENRNVPYHLINTALVAGIKSTLLQPDGKGWQKGTLKMCLEFIPEEIESIEKQREIIEIRLSPLDEIRQLSNQIASVGSIEQN